MIVSLNGMDNSGKTTQTQKLIKLHPDYYLSVLHIKDMPSFDKEKFNFDWWFNPNIKEDFVKVIYDALAERNELAKSLNKNNKVILYDKGNDFYDSRILATLISKGETMESACELLYKIKDTYNLEELEKLKLFLISGNYKRKEQFKKDKQIMYNSYLELNKLILKNLKIDFKYIMPDKIENVTEQIHRMIKNEGEIQKCKKLIMK